jgi:pyruvate,orthophosphate dikinase
MGDEAAAVSEVVMKPLGNVGQVRFAQMRNDDVAVAFNGERTVASGCAKVGEHGLGSGALDCDPDVAPFRMGGNGQRQGQDELVGAVHRIMTRADERRRLAVRTNADNGEDSARARRFGAQGIGLCRTEHMFFAEDRLAHMRAMILATTEKDRRAALKKLLPMQRSDFAGVFKAMDGFPVTIRLLDPPLHEFLPRREDLMVEIAVLEATKPKSPKLKELKKLLRRVEELHEVNPMLGHRGCRLGITYPEITEMQACAIFEAAIAVKKAGVKVFPEVMIPLTATVKEMANQAAIVNRVADEVFKEKESKVEYLVGTMIELPRAALVADEIATEAQFFSFGTNDLTQTTFGFSRDDVNKVLPTYIAEGILKQDPFAVLDREGVGQLVKMATERGRKTRSDLKVGICGEHGGEPSSVEFCYQTGLNYVSCSPFRVLTARLAALNMACSRMARSATWP